jgi:hypothetical protein
MFQLLWPIGIIVLAFALIYVISSFTEGKRIGELEDRFYADRYPMTDDRYSSIIGDSPLLDFHLGARRAMATLRGTTPEMIRPTDSMRTLLDLQFDRGFIDDFIFFTEKETSTQLSLRDLPNTETTTFADFVQRLAEANRVAAA